jgi:sirohydrochlorin ferrochelatase
MLTGTKPPELSTLHTGDILCDRHRRDCYVVTDIDAAGVTLRERDREFVLPYSLFCSVYDHRVFHIEQSQIIDAPTWCEQLRNQL